MNHDNRINKHMSSLSEEDRLLCVRNQINACLSWLRKRNKASDAEFNFDGCRAGVRGGKITTLAANSARNAELYDCSIEDLKKYIKHL